MNRIFTFLTLLLMTCSVSRAQEMTIKSFTTDPTDISASTHRRDDFNKQPCALVKVQLAQAGAKFDGNVVGEVSYDRSIYWVYMTDGSKYLDIQLEGYLPLHVVFEQANRDVKTLRSLATYTLTVLLPDVGNRSASKPVSSFFVITVTPSNASVRIDGELQTLSVDGTYSRKLDPGSHTYLVEAGGYEPQQATFTMGTEKKSVTVNLVSNMATLSVDCATTGADIYVNDSKVGSQSRWSGTLSPADYVVEARKEGYYPQQKSITLGKKQTLNVKLPALTARVGNLEVNYTPVDADVLIDGVKKGLSPDVFRDLLVGSHKVEVRKSGYESKTATVTIREGETVSLTGSLSASTFTASPVSSSSLSASTNSSSSSLNTSSTQAQSYKTCPDSNHPHLIDLGLPSGTKWACCNVEASKPEEYGGYYAWGESVVQANNEYYWSSYKHCDGTRETCHDIGKDISGTRYDVAHEKWGGSWRMPTPDQIKELFYKCSRTWTTRNGKKGIEVTGPNGGKLFLPAAGGRWGGELSNESSAGYYWSSSLSTDSENYARYFFFFSDGWDWYDNDRCSGRTVRAVCP